MTKKRFKFGLAALGLLAAFLVALIGLLAGPTDASGKNSGTTHGDGEHHGGSGGAPNPVYFQNSNGTDPDSGHSLGGPAGPCADNDKSCTGSGDKPDTQYVDDATSSIGNGNSGSSNGSGNGGGGGNSGGNGANGFYAGGGGNGNGGGGGNGGNGNGGNGDGNDPDDSGHGPKIASLDTAPPDGNSPNDPPPGGNPPPDYGPPPFLGPPKDGPGPDVPQPPIDLRDGPVQVPEPLTMSLFAVGLAGTAAMRRRQKGK